MITTPSMITSSPRKLRSHGTPSSPEGARGRSVRAVGQPIMQWRTGGYLNQTGAYNAAARSQTALPTRKTVNPLDLTGREVRQKSDHCSQDFSPQPDLESTRKQRA